MEWIRLDGERCDLYKHANTMSAHNNNPIEMAVHLEGGLQPSENRRIWLNFSVYNK